MHNLADFCAFLSPANKPCAETKKPGYRYCAVHLREVLESSVPRIMCDLLHEQFDLDHEDVRKINWDEDFGTEVGADSLSKVEYILAIEEALSINISDDVMENLDTLSKLQAYITSEYAATLSIPYFGTSAESIIRKIRTNQRCVARIIQRITRTSAMQDCSTHLLASLDTLSLIMYDWADGWSIRHYTIVPTLAGAHGEPGEALQKVDIFLLTDHHVIHVDIQFGSMAILRCRIEDVRLSYRYEAPRSGVYSKLHAKIGIDAFSNYEPVNLLFLERAGISGAESFAKKLYQILARKARRTNEQSKKQ